MDAAPDRADRRPYGDGDLFIAEADHVTHDNGLPKIQGEVEESLLDVLIKPDTRQDFVRARRRVSALEVGIRLEGHRRPAATAANVVEKSVAGDTPEPAFEGAGLIVGEAAPDSEQDFLHEVIGVVAVAT